MSVQWASFIGVSLDALGAALLLIEWAVSFWGSVNTEAARKRIAEKTFSSGGGPLPDFQVVRGRVIRKALPRVGLYFFGLLFLAAGFGFQAYGSYPWAAINPNPASVPAGQFWPNLTGFIDALGKLGPLFISAAVGVVAYWQWQTANAKVVGDLRSERMKTYRAVRDVLGGKIMAQADVSNDVINEFVIATADIKPLFGDDVAQYIDDVWKSINVYHEAWVIVRADQNAKNVERESRSRAAVLELYEKSEDVFMPYIRMTQKIH